MPSEEKALKLMENIPMFETEIKMYSETISALDQLLESFGEKTRFAPEYDINVILLISVYYIKHV